METKELVERPAVLVVREALGLMEHSHRAHAIAPANVFLWAGSVACVPKGSALEAWAQCGSAGALKSWGLVGSAEVARVCPQRVSTVLAGPQLVLSRASC